MNDKVEVESEWNEMKNDTIALRPPSAVVLCLFLTFGAEKMVMSWLLCSISNPSSLTSCDRMTSSNEFLSRNWAVISGPNDRPTPRLLGARPLGFCGSLHSSSHMSPLSGGCWLRSILRIISSVTVSSENRPPWTINTFDCRQQAKGKRLNASLNNSKQGVSTFALHSP